MSADSQPPQPTLPFRRGLNASLATIRAGLRPIANIRSGYLFLFPNGQLRRQIGRGHSQEERAVRRAQRNADYASRREYKRSRAVEAAVSAAAA